MLSSFLEGEFADIRETPRSNNFLVAAFQGGRDFRIAWIQKIHRQLKARLLVLHVDEDSYVEKQLLIFFQEEDVRRINELLSEARTLVKKNADLSGDHKRRLLKMQMKFQRELGNGEKIV